MSGEELRPATKKAQFVAGAVMINDEATGTEAIVLDLRAARVPLSNHLSRPATTPTPGRGGGNARILTISRARALAAAAAALPPPPEPAESVLPLLDDGLDDQLLGVGFFTVDAAPPRPTKTAAEAVLASTAAQGEQSRLITPAREAALRAEATRWQQLHADLARQRSTQAAEVTRLTAEVEAHEAAQAQHAHQQVEAAGALAALRAEAAREVDALQSELGDVQAQVRLARDELEAERAARATAEHALAAERSAAERAAAAAVVERVEARSALHAADAELRAARAEAEAARREAGGARRCGDVARARRAA